MAGTGSTWDHDEIRSDECDLRQDPRSHPRQRVPEAARRRARAVLRQRESQVPGADWTGSDEQSVLRSDPQAAAAGRDFVRCTCLLWGLEATLDAALLVISELVTNAVVHARSPVTVRLRLRPDRLLVEVEDEDSQLPVLQQHSDWDALGGRGLMLVDALAARWGSQPCPFGKVVWAELPLAPDPSESDSARTQ